MVKADFRRLSGLYAITPEDSDTARLVSKVCAALEGGAAVIQYRAKQAAAALALEQASALYHLCASFSVPLIINDSIDLAEKVGADGVHLGRDDCSLAEARKRLADRIIGVSCYNDFLLAERAIGQGADYVAFGSFFPSSIKPHAMRANLDLLHLSRCRGFNVVAIGGITADNAGTLIAGGADAVAVISALFDGEDLGRIRANAEALAQLFHHA